MEEKTPQTALALHKPGGFGFAKGHKRVGGRVKGAVKPFDAVETARRLNFDPIETMIQVVQKGSIVEPDGRESMIEMPERMRMLREVAPFVVSKAATRVEAEVDHLHTHVDITQIMMDPALAAAAEQLALAMVDQTDESPAIEADFEDVTPSE